MNEETHTCVYCGAPATYQMKRGKWCCCEKRQRCPANRERVAKAIALRHKEAKEKYGTGYFTKGSVIGRSGTKAPSRGDHVCVYCGGHADFQLKDGRWCCHEKKGSCPEIRRKNSEGCKRAYATGRKKSSTLGHKAWNKGLTQPKDDFVCKFCGIEFLNRGKAFRTYHERRCEKNPNALPIHKRVFTEKDRKILSERAKRNKIGGYENGCKGGHGKRGYYRGFYCMSSWELAFVYYHLSQQHPIEQCREHFEYFLDGKKRTYTPDFKIDGVYYEIKNYMRPDTQSKIDQFSKDKKLVLILGENENKKYIDFITEREGPDFCKRLYER